MVSSSNRTSKLLTWKSTISVRSIRINSSKEAFCNLFKSVVFPAFPQPTMMHLTWQTEIFPLLRNCLSLSSSISGLCCFPSTVAVSYPDSSFCFSSLWIVFDFCGSFLTSSLCFIGGSGSLSNDLFSSFFLYRSPCSMNIRYYSLMNYISLFL